MHVAADHLNRRLKQSEGGGQAVLPPSLQDNRPRGVLKMKMSRLATLLLLSTALGAPSLAMAQEAPAGPPAAAEGSADTQTPAGETAVAEPNAGQQATAAEPDVSVPGGAIVVTGRRDRNVVKSSDQVVSVLGTADIQRTGEGNIAGALSRVTGLSLVGSGFVYVRGLGDRYSLALLNGSPLPSPEPLRRVVPLDIFPTNVVASSLVQKTYSANFPGEFGGGVVNLTTTAVPEEGFFNISGGVQVDSEATGKFGYTYYGASSDWTGFDDGSRNPPPALAAFFASGNRIGDGTVDSTVLASELMRASRVLLQKVGDLPPNYSVTLTGGNAWDVGDDVRLGFIATAGFSNKWTNRDARQQTPATADLSQAETDFQRVTTDNRILINALLGIGLEFGSHKVRLTNLYIRDTDKQGRLAVGNELTSGFTRMNQDTAWYERQLIDTQFVGEFKFGDLGIDLRGGYANTQREAPYETTIGYVRTNAANDPTGSSFVNRVDNQIGSASVAFSNLNEDLWYGGVDASYLVTPRLTATAGYAYSDTKRVSERRDFQFRAPSDFPVGVGLLRPDLLFGPAIVDFYNFRLFETTESDPAFTAGLRIHGAYGKVNWEPRDGLTVDAGVRYEDARQSVNPLQVFSTLTNSGASTLIENAYWLPAATVTWEFAPQMQLRANASKTIARPQFRELIFQQYYDPETDRQYRGNPLLEDSELFNAEARYEWYFASGQRFSLAGFYKKIDRPIEAFTGFSDNQPQTSYANAPKAELYGAEVEMQKRFDLSSWGGVFDSRTFSVLANYTFTKSKLKVNAGDTVEVFGTTTQPASNFFIDGAPLTGQSDHIANLELGFEDSDRLSQQTVLLSYASKRVTSRGPAGLPDILENPGLRLDVVIRQGFDLLGKTLELKLEGRNLTGRRREEYQDNGTNRLEINTYDLPRVFAISGTMKF